MKTTTAVIFKFLVFILLIPIGIAATSAFTSQLFSLKWQLGEYMALGILAYLFIHHFVYEFPGVWRFGQKLVSDIFRFFAPLVKVAPFFLPIYSIILLIVYYFISFFMKDFFVGRYFMFLLGFTLAMHFVYTAKDLKRAEDNILKPNYFFAMAFIYIANLIIISLFMDLIFKGFSFTAFFSDMTQATGQIYSNVFHQLFPS